MIYPPVAKATEPPPGISVLAGALSSRGIHVSVVDLNLEGQLMLLGTELRPESTHRKRAYKNRDANLSLLRSSRGYLNVDRYARAVLELSSCLRQATDDRFSVGPADYGDRLLSPLCSDDLVRSAERFPENPFFDFFSCRLMPELERVEYRIVGISVNFLNQALCAFAVAGFIRDLCGPSVRIVMGGGLITSWNRANVLPDRFSGLIDDFVDGPGEDFLAAAALRSDGNAPGPKPDSVPALSACLPDFSGFPYDRYLSPVRILPYAASVGCMWGKCRFCPERAEGGGYRPIPARKACGDLSTLVGKYSAGLVHLLDNEISPAFMTALTESPPGAPWYGFVRASPPLTDPEFCGALYASGCRMLKLGVESGSARVLDSLEKGIDIDDVGPILRNLESAGILTYVYLLFGTPEEDEPAAYETLEFCVRHADSIRFLNLAIFNLPSGSPYAETLTTRDFYLGDLSLYKEFSHPSGWNRDKVRNFLDRAFKPNQAIRKILRRTPPLFTSNHAALFHAIGDPAPGITMRPPERNYR